MALSAVYAVGTLVTAGSAYVASEKASKRQAAAAQAAQTEAGFDADANRQAAMQADAKSKLAAQTAKAEAEAAAQLATAPEVTIDDGTNQANRRRTVQAQFNLANGGAGSAGSLRV